MSDRQKDSGNVFIRLDETTFQLVFRKSGHLLLCVRDQKVYIEILESNTLSRTCVDT